ncbi:unnamed protein product [Umbelopsis ramanniana]
MVTKIALQYRTDFANHVVHNFNRFCTNYFFLRLNNEADTWYEANATVKERKSLAEYLYKRATSVEAAWPDVESNEILRSTYDGRAASIELGPTPITEASLFASPHAFLPFLNTVLEYMDNQVHVLESAPQTFASKGYIFRKLNEIFAGTFVPKRVHSSIEAVVYTAIQRRTDVVFGRRQAHNAIVDKLDQIRGFVTQTIDDINAGIFRPPKYTDPKGSRKFTLLPVKSLQVGHIALDATTLPIILRAAGLTTRRRDLPQDEFERLVWQNFDFTHLGFASLEDLFTKDAQWSRCLRSDGVDLEYLFFKKPFLNSEPKTPAHYRNWVLHGENRSTVWGVDPGKTDIFVAVDGSSSNRHRIRTSNSEYYDLGGFNRATSKRRR